jgi:hypothetical protein
MAFGSHHSSNTSKITFTSTKTNTLSQRQENAIENKISTYKNANRDSTKKKKKS